VVVLQGLGLEAPQGLGPELKVPAIPVASQEALPQPLAFQALWKVWHPAVGAMEVWLLKSLPLADLAV
jgi:hypothetical protein